ncbi:YfhO family protein [Macrococcus capreoli]
MFKVFQSMKMKTTLKLISVASLLSLLAHSFVIYRLIKNGTLFTGKGDGIAQMIPFQMYLYNKFTHFHFFYDMDFGLGGDFFRSLSYYYSTALLAYLNFFIVWIGDLFLPLNTTDPVFWAKNQFVISIMKLTLIIIATYKLLRYININRFSSMTSAFLYGWSTVYFFFTFTWSFFSDVMLWLPLTILGLERFFHERKIGLFIIALALTLHSNFYFSYYEFIFVLCYFIYRVAYPKQTDCVNRIQKITLAAIGAIIALGIAAVGIFTGISSYLMNDRTIPPLHIKPFIDMVGFYNLFYDGYYVVICFITVIALMTFKLYHHYMYRLFATITILFMVGSLSPLFDSFFNGFSIDQRRWTYLLVFSSAVLIAHYLNHLKQIDVKSLLISLIPICIIYPVSMYGHEKLLIWLIFIPIICILILIYIRTHQQKFFITMHLMIIMMNLLFVHDYVTEQMDTLHPAKEHDINFLNSDRYNSETQRTMIHDIKQNIPTSDRIEWQTSSTHNTPMYQQFNGTKLYASIFDQDILKFYDQELNITMPTDSNSIYYSLGERTNLYSLFNVNTTIRIPPVTTLPFGMQLEKSYHEPNSKKQYDIFKNQYTLPFVRVTDQVYNASELTTPIDREHAMLNGVVLDGKGTQSIQPAENLLSKATITYQDAALTQDKLVVTKENGGSRIHLPKSIIKQYEDLYVSISIESKTYKDYHYVWLNEIYQSRKPLDDDYRRFNPTITLKVKANELLELKLKPGEYTYKLNSIYGEDYHTLKAAAQEKNKHQFMKNNDTMTIQLGPHKKGYAVLPIPYLKGMTATVDGQKSEVQEGNYLMTAIPVSEHAKTIILRYTPPYFHLMQCIAIISIILAVLFTRVVYRRKIMPINKSHIQFDQEDLQLKDKLI